MGIIASMYTTFLRQGFAGFAAKKGAKNEDFKTSLKMAEWLRDDMKGDVQGKIQC